LDEFEKSEMIGQAFAKVCGAGSEVQKDPVGLLNEK
jgi:hypothetical protein